ncbi:MAG: MarR family transcriptional regulator [Chloroflexi bacterium]|nr:MarR family transcriptional regulator [Chloroflexota bacterium]
MLTMKTPDIQKQYRLIHDVYVLMDYGDTVVLSEYNLTASQMSVLRQLDVEVGCRLTTLSDRVLRSKSAITRIIDSLEAKDLVARVGDPEDRRAQRVVLTEKGARFREEVNHKHVDSLHGRFDILAAEEQQHLTALLDKLRLGLVDRLGLR